MSTMKDILAVKGSQVWTIDQDACVLDAVFRMKENKIGALVVTDQNQLAGIFTERDVLHKVVGARRDPAQTRVSEVMTTELFCCRPETTVDEARAAMRDRRVRHLPVMDGDGRMIGLVSIGDLNAHRLTSQEQTIYMLHEYLYGRA